MRFLTAGICRRTEPAFRAQPPGTVWSPSCDRACFIDQTLALCAAASLPREDMNKTASCIERFWEIDDNQPAEKCWNCAFLKIQDFYISVPRYGVRLNWCELHLLWGGRCGSRWLNGTPPTQLRHFRKDICFISGVLVATKPGFSKLHCHIFTELKLHDKFRDAVLYPDSSLTLVEQCGVTEYQKENLSGSPENNKPLGFGQIKLYSIHFHILVFIPDSSSVALLCFY